jgi:hypothetical protein
MTPSLPAGHDFRAAVVWFGFHLRRHLARRSFWLWAAAVVGFLVLASGVANAPARVVAQGLIVQLGQGRELRGQDAREGGRHRWSLGHRRLDELDLGR